MLTTQERTLHETKPIDFSLLDSKHKRHYIFYMDINGTIMAGDSANAKLAEDGLWQTICENTTDKWPLSKDKEMTYYDYVKYILYPDEKEVPSAKIKALRRDQYKEIISHLRLNHYNEDKIKVIENIFLKLKTKSLDENIYIDANGEKHEGKIFTSFINLINFLEKNKYSYSIVLSTFGSDLTAVITELEARTTLKFNGKVEFKEGKLHLGKDTVLTDPIKIQEYFESQKCHAVKHDWKWWNSHGEKFNYGKTFVVDLNAITSPRCKTIPIFFDDNAKDKQIISIKPVLDEPIDQADIQKKLFQSKHLVTANPYYAILDENYFIAYVKHHDLQFSLRDMHIGKFGLFDQGKVPEVINDAELRQRLVL